VKGVEERLISTHFRAGGQNPTSPKRKRGVSHSLACASGLCLGASQEFCPLALILVLIFQIACVGLSLAEPVCTDGPFANVQELAVDILLEQVLARNPSLAQMLAAWQAASARYPQAISLEDPMLSTMVAPASMGANNVEFGYRLEVSQKVPFPGKRTLRGQVASAEASAAGQDAEDMRLQLVESARSAFYDYFLAERALAVNAEGLRLLQEFQQNAEMRYKTGLVPQQDVLQASLETGRQRQRRLVLERLRRVAMARINTLLHLAPDSPLPPPPPKIALTESVPEVHVLRANALARRPDVKSLADRLRAEQASLALAHKDFCPDFEVTAAYDTIMGNGPARDLAPQLGLRINVPIRRVRRYGAVAEAEARVAQRQAELAKQMDQVAFQVQEAYEQVRESAQTVHLYEQTILPAAQANIGSAQSAYITGKIPFLTLIEAQRGLVELRDRYYEAVTDYFRRLATLERSVGGPLIPGPEACGPSTPCSEK
jgi:cobalt-zinc-cadmium efflux system outer membrane protein